MAYFEVCPFCGANLDPGERCDCGKDKETLKKIVVNAEKYAKEVKA